MRQARWRTPEGHGQARKPKDPTHRIKPEEADGQGRSRHRDIYTQTISLINHRHLRCDMTDKVVHSIKDCIGCGACAAIAPKHWKMGDDGKSQLIDSKRVDEDTTEKEVMEKDLTDNEEAAQSCPTNAIHIIKDGKQVI